MLRILIAEDEEPIANLIRMNLTRAGYQCYLGTGRTDRSGSYGAGEIRSGTFWISCCGINGYELMDYAKACELPVIFLTALGFYGT